MLIWMTSALYVYEFFEMFHAVCLFPTVCWVVMPYEIGLLSFKIGMLFFFCCIRAGVYSTMGAG